MGAAYGPHRTVANVVRSKMTVTDPGEEQQWAIFAAMTSERRVALGLAWSEIGLNLRRERLRATYPHADLVGLRWAQVREILGYPAGTEPIV